MLTELSHQDADIEAAAARALEDDALLADLLDGLNSREETFRYNCFKVLTLISREHGELLYPRWDRLAEQLGSDNTYRRISALQLIANLTAVDAEHRFEKLFDRYFALLDDRSVIPAAQLAGASGRIVRARPELESRITAKLLAIDGTHHHPDRRDLIKGYAIESFDEYYEQAGDKEEILDFVRRQLTGSSPRTRKLAAEFLRKRE
jgi:hypothetical protein